MPPATSPDYRRPVPRYTSYPTAAQFSPSIGAEQHSGWLGQLAGDTASLYLHVPFCRQLCWYCACHTMAMSQPASLDAYAEAMDAELQLLARTAPDLVLDAVQWGGGTPGQLGPARLRALGRRIRTTFGMQSAGEISFELDPRYCQGDLVDTMAEIGVSRVSLGVQDFDPVVQGAINRLQSFEVTATAVGMLRAAGISRFNIDLVYGLPHQTLASLERTIDLAIGLGPSRFAVFGYAHVPWMKPHQKLIDEAALPGDDLRVRMTELVAGRLGQAGYQKIGLDHYARRDDTLSVAARDGRLRRNFQGYVADRSPWVVGVGASAISCLPGGFSQNAVDPAPYMTAIAGGSFATARGVAINDDDRLRSAIIERLMCDHRVDLARECRRFHLDPDAFTASVDGLETLERDGLITMAGGRLEVTGPGRPLVRFVCAAFDRHYSGAEGRHSRGL